MLRLILGFSIVLLTTGLTAQAAQQSHTAMGMGFDQDKTTHHFYLYTDGGAIDVSVKDAADRKNLDAIRSHLPHVAMMFKAGDFSAPMFVHQKAVPGTEVLARSKDHLEYRYRETPRGGRVEIVTTNPEALKALHAFLVFQITDHKTGDSLEVQERKR